jgi:CHAT domain-containing protein/Tfp pilus assembly protein PilF
MTLSAGQKPDAAHLKELLSLPTPEQRKAFLEAEGLLNAEGLDRLLDVADQLVNDDPGKARRLAELCADLSDDADAPAAVPRANYIRARTHAENGKFDAALRMTRAAYDGYVTLDQNLEALRTNVGLMVVLLELGRYEEVLNIGQTVLDTLDGAGELDVVPTEEQSKLLAAMVYQNIGGCYEYMGRYEEALDAYAAAEERYRALGMHERLGEILDNRGAILLHLGRGSEALAAHEDAAAVFARAGLTLSHAKALTNVGEANRQLANYARSLDAFERARRLLRHLDAFYEECFILRNTADTYLELNLYSEALNAYEEVDKWLRDLGISHDRARTLWGMGSTLIALSDLKEAERALRRAADKFAAAGNAPMLSGVMLEQSSVLAAREDREAAVETARRALELASEKGWVVGQVYAHLRLSDLLLPDVDRAETHLLAAQKLADRLSLPHLRFRLNERLGHLRRLQDRNEEARVLLEAATEEIERFRGSVAQEAMRASFLRDRIAAYEDLMLLHLAREDEEGVRRAFAVAERAKSRALVDLLTGVVDRVPAASIDPELEEQLLELQADLNATYNRLLGFADEDEHEALIPDLQRRAVELERKISRLRLHATSSDPFTDPVSFADVQEELPSDVALLTYHVAGDEIMAFVSKGDDMRISRNLGSVEVVAELLQQLSIQWDRFRVGPEFVRQHMALLERSTRQLLTQLYTVLVAPLEPLLEEVGGHQAAGAPEKMVIVPHGLLHQVPFHALFDGERYLLERFEISYAPSARIYSLCQQRARRVSDRALVMSVNDPLIPAVTEEARAVAQQLPGAEVFNDGRVTIDALRNASSDCYVLHLACHGLFRADNPMFSSLKLHDGWLTAADVMQLDLAGALVTLSACESGRNEVFVGDELIGLTRAFLGVGASTLVVSLWLVQDEATAELMEKYYERLGDGASPAEALRAAQLEIKDERPHPYYWAPFVLVGKR